MAPGTALLSIDRFWREGGGCYVQGWFHAYTLDVQAASFLQDEGPPVRIETFFARPDLLPHYPMLPAGAARAGFAVHLPHQAGCSLRLLVEASDGAVHEATAELAGHEADDTFAWGSEAALAARAAAAWQRFKDEVNERRLAVLEVGSRLVAMSSVDLRDEFPHAVAFTGMDIHAAPGVDVVGDVHALSAIVGPDAFDAIFSSAVMEHLAMPWLAAAEMNRALRTGGLVFHRTHQCWPVHEQPNDFFRFSDEALKVLFGPVHGFAPIEAGMAFPMAAYARDKSSAHFNQTPLNPVYGMSWVLARKVADIPAAHAAPDLVSLSQRYPAPPSAAPPRAS